MRKISSLTLGLLLMAAAASAGGQTTKADIVDTAINAGSFETLTAALGAAGLVDALRGDGPFTVFAPTDEAFAKLPAGTVDNLLKPENLDQLKRILTYHVVSGRLDAAAVTKSHGADTLAGDRVEFKVADGAVQVGSATVVKADISTKNGIIHVIDSVLIPN